jgi:hypothetical protein
MFTVTKTYQTLRSITDLKEVNKKIVTLDINMEYYKIIIPDYKVSRTINLW